MTATHPKTYLNERYQKWNWNKLTLGQKLEVELFAIVMIVIGGSSVLVSYEGWRLFDAVYFSIITLAGVGYGDFSPASDIGKCIAMFYAIIGLPLFVFTTSLVVQSNRSTFTSLKKGQNS